MTDPFSHQNQSVELYISTSEKVWYAGWEMDDCAARLGNPHEAPYLVQPDVYRYNYERGGGTVELFTAAQVHLFFAKLETCAKTYLLTDQNEVAIDSSSPLWTTLAAASRTSDEIKVATSLSSTSWVAAQFGIKANVTLNAQSSLTQMFSVNIACFATTMTGELH